MECLVGAGLMLVNYLQVMSPITTRRRADHVPGGGRHAISLPYSYCLRLTWELCVSEEGIAAGKTTPLIQAGIMWAQFCL